ncbi:MULTISPECIES: phospho-sugar mutase [Agathobacter]|uniref:Phosphoglucomutase n=1 Tax=Agathobacter ruminis TaxID=1712665 RepID=A0A2G3E0Q6_9FIRM|nr:MULTISPECIES: phospho-sugar mutase [Agathobacter]MBQ1680589.1 phospho-sugar mutase [Agathobacter sp.]MCR5678168.1 phospho-sugar mutase [Agathobacter sp.]MDC7301308.1 phospho-sugar mutase [Agathobacter ruminis]PHU36811.1 phosphoglucomutase [Agathobacter ruminis]
MDYKKQYEIWCTDPYFDDATKAELKSIANDEKEIEDRFYRTLEFGTAGLRGVIGAGTNRMNIYTVRQATQGLANYIISQGKEAIERGVAIAHDSRNMHDEFTEATALCLAANGIKTYVFPQLAPVPELSYAVRNLHTIAGVVLTASHNPREYNGYKVYWEDGAQVTPPHDSNIMAEVAKVTSFDMVKTMDKEEAIRAGLYNVISDEIEEGYFGELRKLSIHPEIIKEMAKDIKIVYTPLHGTGLRPVQRVLKDLGFENVMIEPSQAVADGNFPTCPYPNPENPDAWKLALELAKKEDADIVLATDPDADRLGVYCKDTKSGEYVTFTGNMSAMLIAEYILAEKTKNHTLPENPAMVESIVSTDMAKAIAKAYNVELIEVLTGFKYIGEKMLEFEKTGSKNYVFGMEESYGCLPGTYARDKDAPAAVTMLCEVAAYCKSQGKTLWDEMIALYEKYGYYREGIATLELKGIDGAAQIQQIMDSARQNAPAKIGAYAVTAVRDYKADTRKDMKTGEVTKTGLPSSNVLYFELENDAWCCVRPSGTEPKIKFYCGIKGTALESADKELEELKADVLKTFGQ